MKYCKIIILGFLGLLQPLVVFGGQELMWAGGPCWFGHNVVRMSVSMWLIPTFILLQIVGATLIRYCPKTRKYIKPIMNLIFVATVIWFSILFLGVSMIYLLIFGLLWIMGGIALYIWSLFD